MKDLLFDGFARRIEALEVEGTILDGSLTIDDEDAIGELLLAGQ